MSRTARWLLLVAGILLLLTAAAHAFIGWPAIREELLASEAPGSLVRAIGIGWLYGSAAMLTFGVIALTVWWWAQTGKMMMGRVAGVIALLYLGFGTWAFFYSSLNPHFIGFIVLGVLLGAASYELRRGF